MEYRFCESNVVGDLFSSSLLFFFTKFTYIWFSAAFSAFWSHFLVYLLTRSFVRSSIHSSSSAFSNIRFLNVTELIEIKKTHTHLLWIIYLFDTRHPPQLRAHIVALHLNRHVNVTKSFVVTPFPATRLKEKSREKMSKNKNKNKLKINKNENYI